MSEFSTLVQEYYQNPINNNRLEWARFSRHEWNAVCGDDITIYMNVDTPTGADLGPQCVVTQRTYDGNVSMVTQAASSFFSELVIWKTFAQILAWNETLMIDNWFEVSPRRRRARVIALVATQNAIHDALRDGKETTFDDVLWE